jgi:hypothetical protein
MFSTGQIGLWSIIEEGIGIIAGSMPALRPLLTLPIFGRSTIRSSNNQQSAPHERLTPNPAPGFKDEPTDEVNMKTFRTSSSNDSPGLHKMRTKTRGSSDDGDSQRNILKETHWTVTAEHTNPADDWARQRVLGWSSRP